MDVPAESVAIHLIALHARLILGRGTPELNRIRAGAAVWGHRHGYAWLDAPAVWDTTIVDVVEAPDPLARSRAVRTSVVSVHASWHETHPGTIERWCSDVLASLGQDPRI